MNEKVHTMTDWYDGPRKGIADYLGRPHLFESLWSTADDGWSELFLLMPLDSDVFELALEDWAIWRRWSDAHRQGLVSIETHPALPEDVVRHAEIIRLIADRMEVNPDRAFVAIGGFHLSKAMSLGATDEGLVKWTITNHSTEGLLLYSAL